VGFIAIVPAPGDAAGPEGLPTLGDVIWWSIVTLSTVGYWDIVPHTDWGRVLGGIVIVFGVTFIAVLYATVTSALLATEREEDEEDMEEELLSGEVATRK
jgi:voltage-gated potassium channel